MYIFLLRHLEHEKVIQILIVFLLHVAFEFTNTCTLYVHVHVVCMPKHAPSSVGVPTGLHVLVRPASAGDAGGSALPDARV